jgi:ADP-ribosylglycohydrolase/protein-tyrosine phosphatase
MVNTEPITLTSRLVGGVWGHLVGDAAGVPYEFMTAARIGDVVFGQPGGQWRQAPGTWSDDGALMLALLDSLLTGTFDVDDQGRRALRWADEGAYTPDGDGKFDIGNTTAAAMAALRRGVPARDAGPTDDRAAGNGSLMRILPLALVERAPRTDVRGPARRVSDAGLVRDAHAASRVTHGSLLCQAACALYVLVVRRLLAGDAPAAALATARKRLRDLYARDRQLGGHLAALDALEAWKGREGTGFVVDSFWSAWDALAGATTYEETIVRSIRYGNDTDTTAAIAGGLAGVHWGWQSIPVAWRRAMRGRAVVTPLADRLAATTGLWLHRTRTSTDSPLRLDEVDLSGTAAEPGRLIVTFLPGKKRDGYTGPHWRDVDLDAARLRDDGVDALFLLVEDVELDWCLLPDLPDALGAAGVELIRFPIRDPHTPTRAQDPGFHAAIGTLTARLAAGGTIAVACRGGVDRSGMTAACLLVEAGLDAETAIDRVHAGRKGSLKYDDQQAYVRSWRRAARA